MAEQSEENFRRWQREHYKTLIADAPAVEGLYGAASNFDHWCRRIYGLKEKTKYG